MIVFGHNSFKLNSCKPSQLGLPPELDKEYTIERRQRYFHLFWIPFFGIGKIWALRKASDDRLYEPNGPLQQVLNSLPIQEKTPWYTFSLVFLALAVLIGVWVYEKVDGYVSRVNREHYLEKRNAEWTAAINSPQPFQYFDLVNNEYKHLYLKVLSSDANTIQVLFSEDREVPGASYDYKILEVFAADVKRNDTLRVAKADMLKIFDQGFEVIPGKGAVSLQDVKEYPDPVLKTVAANYEDGKFMTVVQNIGESATYEGMRVASSNVTFDEKAAFPQQVKAGDFITLQGSFTETDPRLYATVKFKTAKADSVAFDFSMNGSYVELNPSSR